ncbi:glycoside hydrolase family 53 protein [Amphibacillus jilinensis]|uniref:glycoside hydrolase family 53 protein n=1 Tax=Amphibacillus jilinensis TaxID=1216008 RepID=UPI0002EC0F81|nr:glycosyl hydrolase 53 family protein [Amphibacillus jilinensis]
MTLQIKGVDISSLNEVESFGGAFFLHGERKDLFEILRLKGVNAIRLRVWVDPYDQEGKPYLGGTNDLETTIKLATRLKMHGFKFILNLHYSDFWTDPKKQQKPKKWTNIFGKALEKRVYQYTREVLQKLDELDLMPEYIQIGNEITNGMLWPDGRTPTYLFEERKFEDIALPAKEKAFDHLVTLLNAGISATRKMRSAKDLKIIIHLDFGGANDLYRGWFDEITKRHLDFDIIALSYYPYWHGSLQDLELNLNDIIARYEKDILIAETAYAFTDKVPKGEDSIFNSTLSDKAGYPPTVKGQFTFLKDLILLIDNIKYKDKLGLGIIYWEPAWLPVGETSWASYAGMLYGHDVAKPGNHWANQGLFDFQGNALESLNVFGIK